VQDIVSYTELTQKCEAEDIMNMLHTLFSRLDALATALGVFKVETIGEQRASGAWHVTLKTYTNDCSPYLSTD
jgi:hypothetical protein